MTTTLKKTVLISAMIASLGLAGVATNSFAGDHGRKCGGERGEYSSMMHGKHSLADRLERKLDLNKDQVSQIDAITDAQHKAMRDARRSKRDQAKAMMALDPSSPDYQAEIDKLAQQAGEQAEQMVRARADSRAKIAAVLTPEQQEKMNTMKAKMAEKWQRHHNSDD